MSDKDLKESPSTFKTQRDGSVCRTLRPPPPGHDGSPSLRSQWYRCRPSTGRLGDVCGQVGAGSEDGTLRGVSQTTHNPPPAPRPLSLTLYLKDKTLDREPVVGPGPPHPLKHEKRRKTLPSTLVAPNDGSLDHRTLNGSGSLPFVGRDLFASRNLNLMSMRLTSVYPDPTVPCPARESLVLSSRLRPSLRSRVSEQ